METYFFRSPNNTVKVLLTLTNTRLADLVHIFGYHITYYEEKLALQHCPGIFVISSSCRFFCSFSYTMLKNYERANKWVF